MAKDWKELARALGVPEAPDAAYATLDGLDKAFTPLALTLGPTDDTAVDCSRLLAEEPE